MGGRNFANPITKKKKAIYKSVDDVGPTCVRYQILQFPVRHLVQVLTTQRKYPTGGGGLKFSGYYF